MKFDHGATGSIRERSGVLPATPEESARCCPRFFPVATVIGLQVSNSNVLADSFLDAAS